MILHGSVIYYELRKKISCLYNSSSEDIEVDLPLFYETGLNLSGHTVIIDSIEDAQDVSGNENVIFVCHEQVASKIVGFNNRVIIIEKNIPLTNVFNQIMQIFFRFNSWEKIMIENINNLATFDKMFTDIEPIVDQGIFLTDTQFHFISYTKKYLPNFPDLEIHQAKKLFVRPGFNDLDSIKEVFEYTEIAHCLYKNIFFHHSYIGRLGTWYSHDEAKNKFYMHVLNYFAKYLEELYSISGSFERNIGHMQLLKEIFRKYIVGTRVDSYSLTTALKQNFYQVDDEYVLINLATNIKEDPLLYANYIGSQFERKWRGICCIQNEYYTLILVNNTMFKQLESIDLIHELSTIIHDSMITAAISRPFKNIENVYHALIQTKIAFKLGKKQNPRKWLYEFDDYSFEFLLHSALGDFAPEQVCSTIIIKLKEHDRINHTQHYDTLFEYIKNQYNASATAKELYIARSTFLSRLEQITKLVGLDLSDWNVRLYIMLSYKLFEMENKATGKLIDSHPTLIKPT